MTPGFLIGIGAVNAGFMTVFLYTVCLFGFAYIVGHSLISQPVRRWIAPVPPRPTKLGTVLEVLITLVECPACLSVWVGFFAGLWYWRAFIPAVLLALYSCGAVFYLAKRTGLIQ
jgi:hypothetical protein